MPSKASQRANFDRSMIVSDGTSLVANVFQDSHISINTAVENEDPGLKAWTVSRNPTSLFSGRGEVLKRLSDALEPRAALNFNVQRRAVIHGLGGVGKTEVALRFANDHRDDYSGVFWIDCATAQSAIVSFARIARLLKLRSEDPDDVKIWLSSRRKPWLLILDNADDYLHDYQKYEPSGSTGDIVITTRNPKLARSTDVFSESLGLLSLPAARDLLRASAGLHNSATNDVHGENLVRRLGLHTLAIRQAGAFLQEENLQLYEYLKMLESQCESPLKFASTSDSRLANSVFASFEISFEQIKSLQTKGRQDAADALNMLEMLPFFHFEGRLSYVFSLASSYAADLTCSRASEMHTNGLIGVDEAKKCPRYAPAKHGGFQGHARWQNACRILYCYSMISLHETEQQEIISVHPLVHEWLKYRMSTTVQTSGWLRAGVVLSLSLQGQSELGPASIHTQTHICTWLSQEFQSYVTNDNLKVVLPVALQLLWTNFHRNDDHKFDELHDMFMRAIESYEGSLGFQIPHMATLIPVPMLNVPNEGFGAGDAKFESCKLNLESLRAMWMHIHGHDEEALPILKRICKDRESTISASYSEILAARQRLATVYRNTGRARKAIRILDEILQMKSEALRPDHPSRLETEYELGLAYSFDDQPGKAVQIFERMVKLEKESLPENHISSLQTNTMLIEASADNEQYVEAKSVLKACSSALNNTFSIKNEHWLSAATAQARIDAWDGNFGDAIALLRFILDVRRQNIPETHLYFVYTADILASIYLDARQPVHAVDLLEHVLRVRADLPRLRDQVFFESQHKLTRAYLGAAYSSETVETRLERVHVLTVKKNWLPSTLLIIGQSYLEDGQSENALAILESTFKHSEILVDKDCIQEQIADLQEKVHEKLVTQAREVHFDVSLNEDA